MKKIVIGILIVSALLIWSKPVSAQNQFHMGQYMVHQPFVNPASMGSYSKLTAAMFYRNQWTAFDGAPVTQGLNLIYRLPNEKNFLGFTASNDVIGINTSTELSASYAYKIKTGMKSRLIFGLSGALNFVKADLAELNIIQPGDPLFSQNTPAFALPNFKFGTYYYRKRFYAGFSIPNILENKVVYTTGGLDGAASFSPENLHYYLHAGYRFTLNSNLDLNTSTMLKQVSGSPLQIDLNAQVMYQNKIGIGASYRSSNEVLGILTWQMTTDFLLSYAYEFNMGDIGNYSNGSHEVLLVYQFNPAINPVVSIPRF